MPRTEGPDTTRGHQAHGSGQREHQLAPDADVTGVYRPPLDATAGICLHQVSESLPRSWVPAQEAETAVAATLLIELVRLQRELDGSLHPSTQSLEQCGEFGRRGNGSRSDPAAG